MGCRSHMYDVFQANDGNGMNNSFEKRRHHNDK